MEPKAQRAFGMGPSTTTGTATGALPEIRLGELQTVPVNVYDANQDLVVQAPLPGVLPEDIVIEVGERQLAVRAKLRGGETHRQYYLHEWHYGPYERTLDLPVGVDASRANASFSNGVLTISLPKAGQTQPGRIELHRPMPREGHSGHRTG
jgi:HSP20 family protein